MEKKMETTIMGLYRVKGLGRQPGPGSNNRVNEKSKGFLPTANLSQIALGSYSSNSIYWDAGSRRMTPHVSTPNKPPRPPKIHSQQGQCKEVRSLGRNGKELEVSWLCCCGVPAKEDVLLSDV